MFRVLEERQQHTGGQFVPPRQLGGDFQSREEAQEFRRSLPQRRREFSFVEEVNN